MRSVVIIPARYKSSRFPGKPLVNLLGKPMILWVAKLCEEAVGTPNVYIATDDNRIAEVVAAAGYQFIMTSRECSTGTDRLAEAAKQVTADIYINVQGDEPLVNPNDIINIINVKKRCYDEVVNGYCAISSYEDPSSVNIPKVIFTQDRHLVYMSRKAIPGFKDGSCAPDKFYKQVCIYGFNADELSDYANYGKRSHLEASEDIEIIRFFEWGKKIRMVETSLGSLAVDIPEDVVQVEQRLREYHSV